jgi:RimJ/RimL family protein N-acetyltransferase
MIKFVKAHPMDPYLIKNVLPCFHEEDKLETLGFIVDPLGSSGTFVLNDEPIGIIGGKPVSKGTVFCWAFLGEKIKEHPFYFHKMMKKLMYQYFKDPDVNRVYTTVNVGNDIAIRQNKRMGLKEEGTLRKAGNQGQDIVVLSLVRGDDGC